MGGEGCGDEGVCVVGWGGEEEVGFDLILIYVCDFEWSEVREGERMLVLVTVSQSSCLDEFGVGVAWMKSSDTYTLRSLGPFLCFESMELGYFMRR